MAPSTVVDSVVSAAANYFSYMLPVIAVMCGIYFVATFLFYAVFRVLERPFKK